MLFNGFYWEGGERDMIPLRPGRVGARNGLKRFKVLLVP